MGSAIRIQDPWEKSHAHHRPTRYRVAVLTSSHTDCRLLRQSPLPLQMMRAPKTTTEARRTRRLRREFVCYSATTQILRKMCVRGLKISAFAIPSQANGKLKLDHTTPSPHRLRI